MTPQITLIVASVLVGLAIMLAGFWLGPAWDTFTRRQINRFTPQMKELSMDVSRLSGYMRWWGAAMAGAFFFMAFIARMPLFAPVVVYLIYIAPSLILQMRIENRRRLLRDQMVTAGVTLANATRAGLALAQGLDILSKESPEPLAAEFRKLIGDYHRGLPLNETIRNTKNRLNLDGFTLFANAILSCLERGGKVTEALERISTSLQENQRLERKLDADTASGRKVVIILGLFPFAFLLGFYLMDPVYTGLLFSTLIGQGILVVISGMVYASVMWARSILRLDV